MFRAWRFERIIFDRYRFRGLHGREAWCNLEIVWVNDGRAVVIATEVKDNPGASVTNAFEQLAYSVCIGFRIGPSELVWIEHYGYPVPGDCKLPRTFDLVTFTILPRGHDAVFAHPKWRSMCDEDWLALGLEPRQPGP